MTDYCQDFSRSARSDQPKRWRKSLGAIGEAIAGSYLQQTGWRIERRGFRDGRSSGEADLIAIDGLDVTSIIEVKTRSFRSGRQLAWYESAAQSIDKEKRRRLINVTQRFHSFYDQSTSGYRLDVIFIGIECHLVTSLIEAKMDDRPEHFLELIALETRKFLEGNDAELQIIHCQEAFVTKS